MALNNQQGLECRKAQPSFVYLFAFFQLFSSLLILQNSPHEMFSSLLIKTSVVVRTGLGDLFVPLSPREFYWSHFLGQTLFVRIPFVIMITFSHLHNSQVITFPTHSCLLFYSFCASLLLSFVVNCFISVYKVP